MNKGVKIENRHLDFCLSEKSTDQLLEVDTVLLKEEVDVTPDFLLIEIG